MAKRPKRRNPGLPYTGSLPHPLEVKFERGWWPPFYSTAVFRPRLRIEVTNVGETIGMAHLQLDVRPYDGPIGELPSAKEGWVDTAHLHVDEPWKAGTSRSWRTQVRSSSLPRDGTYAARLWVTKFEAQHGTLLEDTIRQLETVEPDPAKRPQLIESIRQTMLSTGIDPHRSIEGQYRGETAGEFFIFEYFRVEPFSSVLNFWLMVWTAVMAVGTLVLAVAALVIGGST